MLKSGNGKWAHFEISDVASDKDGNNKEERSLIALKILKDESGGKKMDIPWPSARLFMVVSTEFSKRLKTKTRAWLKGDKPHCHYKEPKTIGGTMIFEICPGVPK